MKIFGVILIIGGATTALISWLGYQNVNGTIIGIVAAFIGMFIYKQ